MGDSVSEVSGSGVSLISYAVGSGLLVSGNPISVCGCSWFMFTLTSAGSDRLAVLFPLNAGRPYTQKRMANSPIINRVAMVAILLEVDSPPSCTPGLLITVVIRNTLLRYLMRTIKELSELCNLLVHSQVFQVSLLLPGLSSQVTSQSYGGQ